MVQNASQGEEDKSEVNRGNTVFYQNKTQFKKQAGWKKGAESSRLRQYSKWNTYLFTDTVRMS